MSVISRALLSAWLAASALLAPMMLAPWLIPEGVLLAVAGKCRSAHHEAKPCPLCGMTRGFLSIARGEWAEAAGRNPASVPLYLSLAGNELAAAAIVIFRRRDVYRRIIGMDQRGGPQ